MRWMSPKAAEEASTASGTGNTRVREGRRKPRNTDSSSTGARTAVKVVIGGRGEGSGFFTCHACEACSIARAWAARCREALTKNHKEQARFARCMPSRLSLKQGQAGALLSPAHTHAIAEIATQHKDSPVVVNSAARVEPSTLISWLMLSTVPRASEGALPQMAAAAVAEAMTTSGESAMPTRAQSSHPSEGRKGALAVV